MKKTKVIFLFSCTFWISFVTFLLRFKILQSYAPGLPHFSTTKKHDLEQISLCLNISQDQSSRLLGGGAIAPPSSPGYTAYTTEHMSLTVIYGLKEIQGDA